MGHVYFSDSVEGLNPAIIEPMGQNRANYLLHLVFVFWGGFFVINYRCDEATHSSKEEVKGKVGKRMEVELNNGKMETWHSSSSAWQILNSPQAFQQRPEASNLTKTSHSAIIIYYYMKVKNDPQ